MQCDPIVTEIRSLRERRAARVNCDVPSVVKDAQERDAAGDREVVDRPPRRPKPLAQRDSEAVAHPHGRCEDRT